MNKTGKYIINVKRIFNTIFLFCLAIPLIAQEKNFVDDREKLFTSAEIQRIDSLLRQFHRVTGNHVAVLSTDTIDTNQEQYIKQCATANGWQIETGYGMILFLSRKNQLIFITVNKRTEDKITKAQILQLIEAGTPDLKEKRTAEGVIKICSAGIDYINKL